MTTWSERTLEPGTIVTGLWRGHQYRVERLLGEGANGRVYLVRKGKTPYALKLGFDALDHQMEVNALLKLSKSAVSFRRYLVEADDCRLGDDKVPFSVTQYIDGLTIREYLKQRGRDWFGVIGYNLLSRLQELHKNGWAYADMKLENLLVYGYGQVELIDFGGLTAMGRSIKQFTELYDRGAWNAGERVAESSYDLFAFAVLMLIAIDSSRRFNAFQQMLPQNRSVDQLLELARTTPESAPLYDWFRMALLGRFESTPQAMALWRKLTVAKPRRAAGSVDGVAAPWLKVTFVASVALCVATACYFWLF